MKVSIVNPTFFSVDDGERNSVLSLGQFLVKNGITVVLFTFTKAFRTSSRLLSEDVITLEGVNIKKYEPKFRRIIGMRPQLYSPQLIKKLCREQSDIVHIHNFSQLPLLFSILRKVRAPVVLATHQLHENFPKASSLFRKKLFKRAIHRMSKKISRFIVDNPEDRNILRDMGTSEKKIVFLHHRIDYVKMTSIKRREEDIFLTVGRYAPNKGLHNLIDASRLVLDTYPHFKFYLVGTVFDKSYHELLREKIRGFEGRIYLTGPLEEEELASLFSRAKLFIFPSVNDSHGLINIEAMAAGIPVIATKVEGTISHIQDGINGVLIPPDDVSSLVDSILDLCRDNEKRVLLIKRGKETAKKYYWQMYAKEMVKVYNEIIEKNLN